MEVGFKHARRATLPLITAASGIVERPDIKWVLLGGTGYYLGTLAVEKTVRIVDRDLKRAARTSNDIVQDERAA